MRAAKSGATTGMLPMSRALCVASAVAVLTACGCSTTTETSTTEEAPVVTAEECKVHGYDCTKAGAACSERCYASDARKDAYVRLLVDGRALDSRAVPFELAPDGDRALRYGCGLFKASDGTQGLELLYRKSETGSAFEDDTTLRIDDFRGPGRYESAVRYIANDVDLRAGKVYAKKAGCTVEISAGEQGGIAATVACPSVPSKDGTAVGITGAVACGGTALEPIRARLP